MPRRYYDYLPQFHTGHFISTTGAYVLSVGLILLIYNFARSSRKGSLANANPWGSKSIEWTIPSPPPLENFEEIPVIAEDPYNYT